MTLKNIQHMNSYFLMVIGPFDQSITGPKRMANDLTQNRLSYRMLTFRPVRRSQEKSISGMICLLGFIFRHTMH